MNKKKVGIIVVIVIFIVLLVPIIYFYTNLTVGIKDITYSELLEDDSKNMTVTFENVMFNTECSIDGKHWQKVEDDKCTFNVKDGSYSIQVRNTLSSDTKSEIVAIKEVKNITMNTPKYYLALDEEYQLRTEVEATNEEANKTLTWTSDNNEIVTVNDGLIKGISVGSAKVTATSVNGITSDVEVIVTDLIRKPEYDDTKKVVPCNHYTKEEADMLDDILATRIAAEGEGSRAALIQTIRFLTLSFKYKIPYFFEHGRLNNYSGQRYVDGEGRYYHKGLYLHTSKFADLKASTIAGPSIWGCGLSNWDDSYGWTVFGLYPNGLDCSGFVTWAMLNSGHDVGDIGSGLFPEGLDMSDYGEMHELTYEFANERNYKVGDIIARDGHTALIGGIDDNYIYIAESLLLGVRINKLSYTDRNSDLYKLYEYINTLDEFYTEPGTYTDMW